MIALTQRQLAAIKAAAKDRLRLASASDWALLIAGKDYSRFVEELRIEEQNAPGVVLKGELATRLPDGLEEEECRVEHLVNGERILSYKGTIEWVNVGAYRSGFEAGTPSRYAPKTPIGDGPEDDLDYVNAWPSTALYEAASRMGYEGVEIPRTPEPPFTRTGDDTYRWTDNVGEIYEALEGEAKLVAEDTPLSVLTARVEGSVMGDPEPDWTFEEGRDFEYGDLASKSREEGRYARVVAWRELPDGSHEKLAEAKVDNQGKKVRQTATFFIELSDGLGAHAAVYKKAQELAENAQELDFPCVYPPFFLKRNDPVLVRGRELAPDGVWVREYRARLTSVSVDQHDRTGKLKAVGGLVSEVFVASSVPATPPRSDAVKALFGYDHLGDPYFDPSLPWVRDDGSHVVLDVEIAAELGVTVYEDPLVPGVVVVGG